MTDGDEDLRDEAVAFLQDALQLQTPLTSGIPPPPVIEDSVADLPSFPFDPPEDYFEPTQVDDGSTPEIDPDDEDDEDDDIAPTVLILEFGPDILFDPGVPITGRSAEIDGTITQGVFENDSGADIVMQVNVDGVDLIFAGSTSVTVTPGIHTIACVPLDVLVGAPGILTITGTSCGWNCILNGTAA